MLKNLNKTWFWLLIICVVGAVLRIAIPASDVFTGGGVNYVGSDSYYQMDITKQVYDGTLTINVSTLYPKVIIGFAWLVSFGRNSWHVVEVAATFLPVVLAVFIILFVYLIGRRLFSNKAGLIGAAFIALWPGEFFARTLLGAVDYHAFEVFLTTGAACLVILIITQKRVLNWNTGLLVAGVVVMVMLYGRAWPGLGYLWEQIRTASPLSQSALTMLSTVEARPLLMAYNYVPFLDAILAVVIGIVLIRRGKGWQRWLLIAWAAFMWLATFYQVRFDYYLTVPLAVMVGFWLVRMGEAKPILKRGRHYENS